MPNKSVHNEQWQEVLDPTPIAIPTGFGHGESIEARIAKYVRHEVSRMAQNHGMETEEESWDFEVNETDSPIDQTDHEFMAMHEEAPDEEKLEAAKRLRRKLDRRDEVEDDDRRPRRRRADEDDDEGHGRSYEGRTQRRRARENLEDDEDGHPADRRDPESRRSRVEE